MRNEEHVHSCIDFQVCCVSTEREKKKDPNPENARANSVFASIQFYIHQGDNNSS